MKKAVQTLALGLAMTGAVSMSAQNLNITLAAQLSYGTETLANICGYASGGNEYALVGAAGGMSIVDVTTPSSPNVIVQIPMVNNLWKEIKVYSHYAYVTTEGSGGALQIVDLNALPATNASSYSYHTYTGDGSISGQLSTVHALHIDTTKGYLYLTGTNLFQGGCVILNLNVDPYNPTYVGHYTNPAHNYVHDCYVDNDTMYAAHIYDGVFCAVDVTNKANPVVLATQNTPTNFTHNTWLTADRKHLLTTDENTNSYIGCYDISNLNNITEMDRIQSQNPNSGSIVHNTHVLNANYAVTSWYRDGIVITDITRPHNLVNVGYYDTYTIGSGNGFDGAWGVYPFLPSGTLVVSNIDEGLYVLSPTYVRACYLEGTVTDSLCGTPISNVTVTISTVNVSDVTAVTGAFATGTPIPGTYTVTFSKPGYVTRTFTNQSFTPGNVVNLNVMMTAVNAVSLNGQVTDPSNNGLPNLDVIYTGQNTYNFTTNGTGNYTNCDLPSDTYTITTGAWGYETQCNAVVVNPSNSNIVTQLQPGWYDDFSFDFGWTVSSTASTGTWERGVPIGTTYNSGPANPGADVTTDCTDQCYVTGNGGGSATTDDIDGGATTLTSPVFDLSSYNNPTLEYDRWFMNAGGSGNPNDSLVIKLSNGTTTVVVETVTSASQNNASWVHRTYNISSLITPTATMQVSVRCADANPGHIVEGGFDRFAIVDAAGVPAIADQTTALSVFPNPFGSSTQVRYGLNHDVVEGAHLELKDIAGRTIATYPVTGNAGTVTIQQQMSAGIYFVQLVNGSEILKPVKIVKAQ